MWLSSEAGQARGMRVAVGVAIERKVRLAARVSDVLAGYGSYGCQRKFCSL